MGITQIRECYNCSLVKHVLVFPQQVFGDKSMGITQVRECYNRSLVKHVLVFPRQVLGEEAMCTTHEGVAQLLISEVCPGSCQQMFGEEALGTTQIKEWYNRSSVKHVLVFPWQVFEEEAMSTMQIKVWPSRSSVKHVLVVNKCLGEKHWTPHR